MRKPWWIFMYSVHHDDPLSENKADACMRKWLVEKCLDVVWSFAIYKPRANIFRLGNVCWAAFGSGKFCEDLLALTFSGGEKCNEGDPLGCVGGAGRGKCIGLLRDDRLGFSRSGKVCLRWSVKLRNTWFKWVRNHLRWKERYRNRRLVRQRQRDYLLRDAGVRQDCLGFARSVNTCLR